MVINVCSQKTVFKVYVQREKRGEEKGKPVTQNRVNEPLEFILLLESAAVWILLVVC